MKSYYSYILMASALLTAAAACTKPDPTQTALPDAPITLSATSPDTKAMLTGDTFKADGNRIKVYDFVTNGNTTTKHIDSYAGPDVTSNSPLHVEGTTWPFTDEIDGTTADVKQWIPGTHKFFGWLAKDVNFTDPMTPKTFFGNGFSFNETSQILTIPSKTLTATTDQFDFMYSNIYTTEPINEPVDLEFSHLFTAISFGLANGADEKIQINEISIKLYTSRSATFNYNTGTFTYSAVDETNLNNFISNSTGREIDASATQENAFDFTKVERQYYLLWPLYLDYGPGTNELKDCSIHIEYSYDSNGNTADGYENKQSKTLDFPAADLLPGKRYHFTIGLPSQTKLDVTLKCEVCPWETASTDIEFN